MSEHTHAEIQELLGAYALDAVDGEEYEAVELHLRECPRCRAEVADHREIAALIGHGGAPAPEGVWDRIIESLEPAPPRMRLELRAVEPEAAEVDGRSGADPSPTVVPFARPASRRPSPALAALAVAAALIIAVLGGVAVHLNHQVHSVQNAQASTKLSEAAAQALVAKGGRQVDLKGTGKGKVPAVVGANGQGYLLASAVPRTDAAQTYQLWGVVDQRVISLGVFPGATDVVPFHTDRHVTQLAITEEQAGGVVVSHQPALYAGTV